jgi:hypothetical protein
MSSLSITASLSLFMLSVLGITLWSTIGAAAPVAWVACGVFSLMLPLLLKTLNDVPAKTVAEILRDVEAEAPR